MTKPSGGRAATRTPGGASLGALRKVRGRSPAELRERGAQALAALLERPGLAADAHELSDDALWRRLDRARLGAAVRGLDDLLAHFRTRAAPHFFAGFDDPVATVAALRRRWPHAVAAIVADADRIRAGRFDLLGRRDVSFGDPVDWHRDPVAGMRAPALHWSRVRYLDPEVVGDHKLVWELNRHQYFVTLGRAYWYTGDEAYARTFVEHLAGWMDANPPKVGVNWASSLEVALRAIAWLWALHFFRRSPALTPGVFARALKFLYVHARHLETYPSTYFSPNTHLTGEALGLLYLGTMLPEFAAAPRWRATGSRILAAQLARHILADGVYFERASYYQRYTIDFYLHATILAGANGARADSAAGARLQAALDHLMYLARPDGRTPLVGDDDGGVLLPLDDRPADDFRASLATGAILFGRRDYAFAAGGPSEQMVWMLGPDALGRWDALRATPPARTSVAFPDGGYYVMRDGWGREANYLLIDCGPHGVMNCGHAHADALAIDVAALGRPMLVDPGTYTYTTSPRERDRYRSSAAHNTLTVDGESSSVPAGPFSWAHVARAEARRWLTHDAFDFFEGSHDGYARLEHPAVHARSVLFIRGGYWVVRDRVESQGPHRVNLHFHCAPGVAVDRPCEGVVALRDRDGEAALWIATFGAGAFHCEDGWVSPVYGRRERAAVCTLETRAHGSAEVVTLLVPATGAEPPAIEMLDAGAYAVRRRDGLDVVLVGAARAARAGVTSDAEWTWVRRAPDGSVSEFLLVDGGALTVDGAFSVHADGRRQFVVGRRVGGEWLLKADGGRRPAVVASGVGDRRPVRAE